MQVLALNHQNATVFQNHYKLLNNDIPKENSNRRQLDNGSLTFNKGIPKGSLNMRKLIRSRKLLNCAIPKFNIAIPKCDYWCKLPISDTRKPKLYSEKQTHSEVNKIKGYRKKLTVMVVLQN
jgi:hypothetical protein